MAYRDVILADLPGGGSFWEFTESSGTFSDSGGAGVTGTAVGRVDYKQAGPWPGAFSIGVSGDGTKANYIDFGDNHDLTGNFSLEAWIFVKSLPSGSNIPEIFHKQLGGSGSGYRFSYDTPPAGRFFIQRFDSVGGSDFLTSQNNVQGDIPVGRWLYLGASYNGTNQTLYKQGALIDTAAAPKAVIATVEPLLIGAGQSQGDVLIALPAIYDGAVLTNAQFANHFSTGQALISAANRGSPSVGTRKWQGR